MTCTDLVSAQEGCRASAVSRKGSSSSDGGDKTAIVTPQFLRVHIDSYTAVVQKKPITLRDALQKKLKNQNLDIEKCVAFIKESK